MTKEDEWEAKYNKWLKELRWDWHRDFGQGHLKYAFECGYNQGRQSALPSSDIWKPLFSGNTAKYSKKIKERVAYADGAVAMYRYIKSHIEQKEQE